ncbi:MAG TPA: SNF2-related protein [Blastocatellia bacterium]|nr:SNF2-related protein [Blastocatellia bacterium]HMY71618.1 SNF2-related protein [Blastocatellia bacterium]
MTRKISAETRRKLMEMARARWARVKREDNLTARTAGVVKPSAPAVVAALSIDDLKKRAGNNSTVRGIAYFVDKGRIELVEETDDSVTLNVRGSEDYEVSFDLEPNGEIFSCCDCPYSDYEDEVICKHKIAAALFLKDHYDGETARKPAPKPAKAPAVTSPQIIPAVVARPAAPVEPDWRKNLATLLRGDVVPHQSRLTPAILFFSFIRRNHRYVVQPGAVPASAIPAELWNDRSALREYLTTNQESLRAETFSLSASGLNSYRFVNAEPAHTLLVSQAAPFVENSFNQYGYYNYNYGYSNQVSEERLWLSLSGALTFLGNEHQLIKQPLEVLPEAASVELNLQRQEDGLHLSPVLLAANQTIKLNSETLEVFHQSPLWLREGQRIFRVGLHENSFKLLQRQPDVVVPPEAANDFYQRNFADVTNRYQLRGENVISETLAGVAPQPRLYLTEHRLTDGSHELRALLRFSYNGFDCVAAKTPPTFSYARDPEKDMVVKVMRNAEAETQWWQRLGTDEFGLKHGHLRDNTTQDVFPLRKKIHPFDFLKNLVPKLTAAGTEIFGEADLTLAKINRARPTISFNITSGIDWFDVQAVINFGELEVSLADIRKSLRKKERFIKLADGSVGEIPDEWLQKYKHLFGLSEVKEDGFRVARHHVTMLDQLLSENEQVTTDKGFEKAREWLKNFQGIQEHSLPANFSGELRPYQKAGFDWLHFLRESRFGGCLADDMGTGKTIQTLCFLQSVKEEYEARNAGKRKKEPRAAHLLVVPRSLVTNWMREAEKFTPNLRILDFAHAERAADIREFDNYDLVLTTYGILLREIERLIEYEFDTAILDEAQAIKNPVSESAKAARLIKCRHKLTLTGTPVENNTLELWSQFSFLNPGLLGSADYFREDFAGPIERQQDETATATLRRLVYPFILRRTKDQVALDLPPRSEKILWNEMEPAQRKVYNTTRDEYRAKILKLIEDKGVKDARFRILEGLLRLRQICNHPKLVQPGYKGNSAKLDTLLETIETLRAEKHKVLVFSQFVQMLKLIETQLKKAKIPYTYLDGSTTNRQARVDEFQTDENIPVFLISLKAGGVGLNLTAADYVIHVDPWWNPAVEMQASDRAHRIGQDKPVFVYKLMMRDSVEEKILQLQERKRTLVKQLISTEAGFFKSLTADDIAALFS